MKTSNKRKKWVAFDKKTGDWFECDDPDYADKELIFHLNISDKYIHAVRASIRKKNGLEG